MSDETTIPAPAIDEVQEPVAVEETPDAATPVEEAVEAPSAPAELSQEERQALIPSDATASPEPVTVGVCESTGTFGPLYAVRHHQLGNPHVWLYSKQAKLAHDIEVATVSKLKEIGVVNPAAVNDPKFVSEVRATLTKELMG